MDRIIQVLKELNVPLSGYQVNNEPRSKEEPLMVIAGGLEELISFRKSSIKEEAYHHAFSSALSHMKERGEDIVPMEYNTMMPYTVVDGKFDYMKLQMIRMYKSVDKLSSEDVREFILNAQKIGYLLEKDPELVVLNSGNDKGVVKVSTIEHSMVDTKSVVESNLCYIFEKEPTTNTLAMSKQFNIKHMHIIEKLFALVTERPSILNHIYWNVCTYVVGKGATTCSLFLEIDEFAYQLLVRSLGKAKSKEKQIFMYVKLEEYYNAFVNMRNDFYNNGGSRQEMASVVDRRRASTEELFLEIHKFVSEYNLVMKSTLTFDLMKRIINNLNNKHMGINSLEWTKNRYNMNTYDADSLSAIEKFSAMAKNLPKTSPSTYILGLYNALHANKFLNKEELEIMVIKDLKAYEVEDLWTRVKEYV